MGVRIAIDHFGSGASSLKQLRTLPIDMLKLDKAFACDVSSPTHDIALARAIMASALTSRLIVVVEGVVSRAQLAFLRAERCDAIQGSLISRPLPHAEATAFVDNFDSTAFAKTSG